MIPLLYANRPSDLDEGAEWRARLVAEADALLDGAEEEAAETQLHVWQAVRQQVQLHRGHLCRHLDAAWDRLVAFQPTKPGDGEPFDSLADCYWVFSRFSRFYRVSHSITWFHWVLPRFYKVLPGFT